MNAITPGLAALKQYHEQHLLDSLSRLELALKEKRVLWVDEAEKLSSQMAVRITNNNPYPHVKFTEKKGTGSFGRNRCIFKNEYRERQYVCYNRTELIRLIQKVIVFTDKNKCRITCFLKRCHLSKAEITAIQWFFGYRFEDRKSRPEGISINGVVKPPTILPLNHTHETNR